MSKFPSVLLSSLALLAAAPASAQQPPAERYTFNVIIETPDGKELFCESRKCDALNWCEGASQKIPVAGKLRLFNVKSRWAGPLAGPQLVYEAVGKDAASNGWPPGRESMPFRNGERVEALFYDSPLGYAWQGQEAFARGPIARMRLEIRY